MEPKTKILVDGFARIDKKEITDLIDKIDFNQNNYKILWQIREKLDQVQFNKAPLTDPNAM